MMEEGHRQLTWAASRLPGSRVVQQVLGRHRDGLKISRQQDTTVRIV